MNTNLPEVILFALGYICMAVFLVITGLVGIAITVFAVASGLVLYYPLVLIDKIAEKVKNFREGN